MALPSSGEISLSQVNVELSKASGASISMNDTAVRNLFGVASGAISMSNGYGKSNGPLLSFCTSAGANDSSTFDVRLVVDSNYPDIVFNSNGTIWMYDRYSGPEYFLYPVTTGYASNLEFMFTLTNGYCGVYNRNGSQNYNAGSSTGWIDMTLGAGITTDYFVDGTVYIRRKDQTNQISRSLHLEAL